MKIDKGTWVFTLGFFLAAIPLTYWLLSLPAGDNSLKVVGAIIVEFTSGFLAQATYNHMSRSKSSN